MNLHQPILGATDSKKLAETIIRLQEENRFLKAEDVEKQHYILHLEKTIQNIKNVLHDASVVEV